MARTYSIKKTILYILKKNAGRKRMQKIYEALFHFSLIGMNFGNNGSLKETGELNILKKIKNIFQSDELLTVFDAGANVGEYPKLVSNLFGVNTTIHSFEPSKKTFEKFLENTSDITNIIPNNFGFSDTGNNLLLFTNRENSGLASVYQRNLMHFGIEMNISEEIKLSTIDKYCENNNISRIHILKLDIVGHELHALKGANEMINNKKIDFIQFEFGGCNIDSRTYFQDFFYLLKDKYRIFRILRDGLVEIPEYNEKHEVFLKTNYLAVCRNNFCLQVTA